MEPKNDVYVISLDAVDLNALPITYKPNDKIVPLWSKSNLDLRSNEYYEFQIKINEDIQEEKNPVIEYVTCHICDIDVPKVYLNEHKNSFKHKFSTKIADVALKRLQLYMNRQDDTDSETVEKDPATYYCLECSTIIDSKEEISHKKSITHKNSMLLERFLNDFLNFYTNDELIDKQENIIVKTEVLTPVQNKTSCTIQNNNKKDSPITVPIEKNNTRKDNSIIVPTEKNFNKEILKEPLALTPETKIQKNELTKDNTKKDYSLIVSTGKQQNKNIIKKEPLVPPAETKIKKNEPTVTKKDETLIAATVKQINKGILEKASSVSSCNPYMSFNNYLALLIEKYKISPNIFKANGGDVEIKTIDGSVVKVPEENFYGLTTFGDSYNYCVICERLFQIKSRDIHLRSDEHMKVMSLPFQDKHCIRWVSDSSVHCFLCNVTLRNYVFHTICSIEHKQNLRKYVIFDIDDENKEKKDVDSNVNKKDLEPKTSNDGLKDKTPNGSKRSKESNSDDENTTPSDEGTFNNVKINIKDQPGLNTDEVPGKKFCNFCNVWISVKKVKKHENTMKHIFNTMSDYHYLIKIKDTDNLICKICEITVENTVDDIENHFTNAEHISKYNQLLKINSVITRDKLVYYCVKCSEYFLHKNEYLHIISTDHKTIINFADEAFHDMVDKINELVVDKDDVTDETVGNLNENVEPTVENADKTVDKTQDTVDKVNKPVIDKVDVADETLGNLNKNVEPTDNADKTVETVKKVELSENLETNYYFCDVCQVKVPNNENNINIHLTGRPHMRKLTTLTTVVVEKYEQSAKAKDTTNLHYQMEETKIPGVVSCIVCNVDLTNSEANILKHIEGGNHMQKYNEFFKKNHLISFNNSVYCTLCSVDVGIRCEFSHCMGKRHAKNSEIAC